MSIVLPTEENLLSALKSGDEKAFEVLYERYWPEVYTMIYRRIGDKEATKDIVQNIFVNLWLSREKIIAERSLAPLLNTTARKKAISWYKKNLATQQRETNFQSVMDEPGHSPQTDMEAKELQAFLDKEIEKMPPTMKQTFLLSRYENKSIREIAAELSLSEQTIRNNISMALERLRDKAQQFYTEPANLAGIIAILLTKV